HQRGLLKELSFQKRAGAFVILATILGLAATAHATEGTSTVYVLLGISLAGALTLPWHRLPEVLLAAQAFAVIGFLKYLGLPNLADPLPGLVMVGASLFHLHWWQRSPCTATAQILPSVLIWLHSALAVGTILVWALAAFAPNVELPVFAGLGLLVFAYGLLTRTGSFVAMSQIFVAATLLRFVSVMMDGIPWIFPASAFGLLALQSGVSHLLQHRLPDVPATIFIPHRRVLEVIALVGATFLVFQNVPASWIFLVLSSAAFFFFFTAATLKNSVPLNYAIFLALFAAFQFLRQFFSPAIPSWQDFAGIALLLISQQIGRRRMQEMTLYSRPVEHVSIAAGILGLWLLVGEMVAASAQGFFLTVSWAVVAAISMTLGFALKERAYRWAGLVILCLSIVRIMVVDVWQLETIYRILSFLVLGVILVAIGFLYNRFADALRKWM
ncbi:MAG: DUF2339 domain-containing protein, partial [Terrimicrobiaceae bacterium]